jgi:hypothetical protein
LNHCALLASNLSHVVPVHAAMYVSIGPTWWIHGEFAASFHHWNARRAPACAGATKDAGVCAPLPHAMSGDVGSSTGPLFAICRIGEGAVLPVPGAGPV